MCTKCAIGSIDPRDLEHLTIDEILEMSKVFPVHGYPEPLESSLSEEDCNGAMKRCAKNLAEVA